MAQSQVGGTFHRTAKAVPVSVIYPTTNLGSSRLRGEDMYINQPSISNQLPFKRLLLCHPVSIIDPAPSLNKKPLTTLHTSGLIDIRFLFHLKNAVFAEIPCGLSDFLFDILFKEIYPICALSRLKNTSR